VQHAQGAQGLDQIQLPRIEIEELAVALQDFRPLSPGMQTIDYMIEGYDAY